MGPHGWRWIFFRRDTLTPKGAATIMRSLYILGALAFLVLSWGYSTYYDIEVSWGGGAFAFIAAVLASRIAGVKKHVAANRPLIHIWARLYLCVFIIVCLIVSPVSSDCSVRHIKRAWLALSVLGSFFVTWSLVIIIARNRSGKRGKS